VPPTAPQNGPGRGRVLVVDDDAALAEMLGIVLRREGYEPAFVSDGNRAVSVFQQTRPDLVLLDLMLPGRNGLQICQDIRTQSTVPIVMLTAKGDTIDVVQGLEAGADDYVTKPFRPLQLAARIRALLRRKAMGGGGEDQPELLSFDGGNLVVDTARRVAVVHGREVALSATEYRLLETLARHAGQVLTHDQILEHVWGHNYAGETGYVKTYVGLLRNKIEPDPKNPVYVMARRGLGYYLERRTSPRPGETAPSPTGSTAPAPYGLPAAV